KKKKRTKNKKRTKKLKKNDKIKIKKEKDIKKRKRKKKKGKEFENEKRRKNEKKKKKMRRRTRTTTTTKTTTKTRTMTRTTTAAETEEECMVQIEVFEDLCAYINGEQVDVDDYWRVEYQRYRRRIMKIQLLWELETTYERRTIDYRRLIDPIKVYVRVCVHLVLNNDCADGMALRLEDKALGQFYKII
ncbi:hypothetical protein RFI_34087, partial [Reticulomyxa filosa]